MHSRRDGLIDGILLLYHHPPCSNAPTILEHVRMFQRHSRFGVCEVNTDDGFIPELAARRFRVVLLHYSLFGGYPYQLSSEWRRYLAECDGSYKVAFFQDEYYRCPERFEFIRQYKIDCIYSLLRPHLARKVYGRNTPVRNIRYTIPSFVSDELITNAQRLLTEGGERPIDVGYRARPTYYHMGRGAREKTEIAEKFKHAAAGLGLRLDIETDEHLRIYGDAWPQFLASCKAVLGVEAGVSIFDVTDQARRACEAYLETHRNATFEEVHRAVLEPWEDRLYYRTIGPRHFEAAALKTCQILYEGDYSGILKPMVHYIPLAKDFSNFDEVMRTFGDQRARSELVEAAYEDLIASGTYSCERFIDAFDRDLIAEGIYPSARPGAVVEVITDLQAAVAMHRRRRRWRVRARAVYYRVRRAVSLASLRSRFVRLVWRAGSFARRTLRAAVRLPRRVAGRILRRVGLLPPRIEPPTAAATGPLVAPDGHNAAAIEVHQVAGPPQPADSINTPLRRAG